MTDLIGKSLGRYHILSQLGEGGMATVYKAYDTRLETDVAVKVIRTENILPSVLERSLKRFEREAKSLARLTHPNIVKVTDYGEFEGKPYLVMPYLPGGTLKDRIRKGQIPWQEAVRLLLPIAQALEYAHKQNLIHRDVKPSNIMLTESGQPMLTDFGVAKLFDMDNTGDLTGTGMGVGTPEYMAPEQWQGQVSVQTDVYALGVVLYEMVTGRRPYNADTPAALLIKQINDPLPRPKGFVPGLPDATEKVIIKALAKKIEDRYKDVAEFVKALEMVRGKSVVEARTPKHNVREIPTFDEMKPETATLPYEEPMSRKKKSLSIAWIFGIVGVVLIVILAVLFKKGSTSTIPTQTPTIEQVQDLKTVVAATMKAYQTLPHTLQPTTITPIAIITLTPAIFTNLSLTSTSLNLTSTPQGPCTDKWVFIADITIPDNTQMASGQDFIKTWKIKNTGTCIWNTDYGMTYVGYSAKMNGIPVPLTSEVVPGQEVEVSVQFKAPSQSGTYVSAWTMVNANSIEFFDENNKPFYVKIVVR